MGMGTPLVSSIEIQLDQCLYSFSSAAAARFKLSSQFLLVPGGYYYYAYILYLSTHVLFYTILISSPPLCGFCVIYTTSADE